VIKKINGVLEAQPIRGRCATSYDEIAQSYDDESEFFSNPCDLMDQTKIEEGDVMTGALIDDADFYRIVRVFGVYRKDVNNTNTELSSTELTD